MRAFLVAAATSVAIATPLSAVAATNGLEVLQPWSRPAAAGTTGIGYMVLANHGRAADVLEKAESPVATRVEMHSSSMAGGIMSMKKQDRVTVPAAGKVIFGPGAYHLMFVGLTRPLNPGDQVPATLRFASGARISVRFTVSSGAGPPTGPTSGR